MLPAPYVLRPCYQVQVVVAATLPRRQHGPNLLVGQEFHHYRQLVAFEHVYEAPAECCSLAILPFVDSVSDRKLGEPLYGADRTVVIDE
jgi:hypothetical protein